MMDKFSEVVECIYLVGDDQVKVWLCDDCRQAANAAGTVIRNMYERDVVVPSVMSRFWLESTILLLNTISRWRNVAFVSTYLIQ